MLLKTNPIADLLAEMQEASTNYVIPPIKTATVIITPEIAQKIINDRNLKYNRKVSLVSVKKYVKQIQDGEWMMTHQGIAFDRDGNLIDGQHRLLAIIEAGEPVMALVCYDLDPDIFTVLDSGRNRNAADNLSILGVDKYTNEIAAVTRLLMNLERQKDLSKLSYMNYSKTKLTENAINYGFEDLQKAVALGHKVVGAMKLNRTSMYGFIYSALKHGIDEQELVESFLEPIRTGAGLEAGHPVLALRNKFTVAKRSQVDRTRAEDYATLIHTWNQVKSGVTVKKIMTPRGTVPSFI